VVVEISIFWDKKSVDLQRTARRHISENTILQENNQFPYQHGEFLSPAVPTNAHASDLLFLSFRLPANTQE
jgi:hypothetical protein